MSSKLKCYQNWNVTKPEMSPKIKIHQELMMTKNRISSKLKCQLKGNVTKTEMLPNIIIMSWKSKSKYKRSALITLVLFYQCICIMFKPKAAYSAWTSTLHKKPVVYEKSS